MADETYLFIGGPRDGDRLCVSDAWQRRFVKVPSGTDGVHLTYRRREFAGGTTVYLYEALSDADMMRLFADRYVSPRGSARA